MRGLAKCFDRQRRAAGPSGCQDPTAARSDSSSVLFASVPAAFRLSLGTTIVGGFGSGRGRLNAERKRENGFVAK